MSRIPTHYDQLKVDRQAPAAVIRAAYKALCQIEHPDKNPGPDAARRMAEINAAYEALIDPEKRAAHDKWIDEHERAARNRETARPQPTQTSPRQPRPTVTRRTTQRPAERPVPWAAIGIGAVVLVALGLLGEQMMPAAPSTAQPTPTALAVSTEGNTGGVTSAGTARPALPGVRGLAGIAPGTPTASTRQTSQYVRSATAPNGQPWPDHADYLANMPDLAQAGGNRIQIDNRGNISDVYVKLMLANGEIGRHIFIPSGAQFQLEKLASGEYFLTYVTLDSGQVHNSERILLEETQTETGTVFSNSNIVLVPDLSAMALPDL